MLSFIGDAYETRHKQTGNAADLHQALSFWQQAIDQGPPTDPSKVEQLLKLGKQYENLFHESDDLRDLDLAIELYEKAITFEDPFVNEGKPDTV
jgi:tetratricopeptide (TPR) repeat protein